jgi:hypothetical protein
MTMPIERELSKGHIRTRTLIDGMAEQVEHLSEAQGRIARRDDLTAEQAREAARSTADILHTLADSLRMHALQHLGEDPIPLPPAMAKREVERLIKIREGVAKGHKSDRVTDA